MALTCSARRTDAAHRHVADDEGGRRGRKTATRRASTSSTSAPGSRISRRRSTSRRPRTPRIDANFTRYTPNPGIVELREAVCAPLPRPTTASTYAAEEVIITAGGKQALFNTALALFGPGDEVITHAPGWPTIVEQIKLAGATPVIVPTHAEDGFALHAARSSLAAITPKTKAIIINSPGNPTGALITEGEARGIADGGREARHLGRRRPLLRAADLRQGAAQPAEGAVRRDARSDGAVRLGVEGVCDDRLAVRLDASRRSRSSRACNALQSHATSNVNSITQKAVVAALTGPQQCVTDMLDEYQRRRDQHADLARGRAAASGASSRKARSTCSRRSADFLSPDGIGRRWTSPTRCSPRSTSSSRPAKRSTRRDSSASRTPPRWSAARRRDNADPIRSSVRGRQSFPQMPAR